MRLCNGYDYVAVDKRSSRNATNRSTYQSRYMASRNQNRSQMRSPSPPIIDIEEEKYGSSVNG